ncbi:MAG: Asp23/Gls24 family envelope stress response protein [Lachnospiraceae bacterium]|nr:Asp23/Gls24 family envelope stress response protein [Lachnospiraceae bacterium]
MAQEIETVVTEENVEIGTIKIAEEVVAMIAAYATLEVEGISSISGNITADNVSEATFRKLSKGVKVAVEGDSVKVSLEVIMKAGFNIPGTSSQVQTRVKNAISNMTGLNATDINIRIAGIAGASES